MQSVDINRIGEAKRQTASGRARKFVGVSGGGLEGLEVEVGSAVECVFGGADVRAGG